jgi:hypothetical protein
MNHRNTFPKKTQPHTNILIISYISQIYEEDEKKQGMTAP